MTLRNTDVAELLARAAEEADGHRARAYASASRTALLWDEEVADVIAQGRSAAELERVGPSLSKRIRRWVEDDTRAPEPPPLRAGFSSFAEARRFLARHADGGVRGDLQMHTVYSDGQATVEEMVLTGAARGYDYVAITDHSKGLRIAHGIDEETLARQEREIAELNERLAAEGLEFSVLRSLEMNIDPDGGGDMEAASLTGLDLVLGSFHSALRRTEDQTGRYLAAINNPYVDVIGHPRGRKYNFRLGLQADWARVAEAAARADVALETNAFPNRQDLDVGVLELVHDAGGRVSIGTDAHNQEEMRFIDIGIAAALRAGIAGHRILNTLTLGELKAWVAGRRALALDGGGRGKWRA